MSNQDPVLEVLLKLEATAPVALKPLIEAYRAKGIDGLDESWKAIVQEAIDENQ